MVNDLIVGYHIQEKLYESRKSLVYRGYERSTHQSAILKILKDEYPSPEKRARFQREYAITQKLGGNGVIEALKIEKHQNTLLLILEDFGGESLDKILKNRTLDLNTFLQLAIRITEILEHIHQAHIIHKDISPSNIVWNPATNQLKLIDFGISSELSRETAQFVNVNSLEGTLAYISPEQTGRMNRSLDYRTDFYSLGVTLYEMLTGQRPFETHDVLEMVHCHLAQMPVPPCELPPPPPLEGGGVPQVISDIILKLMAKNAENRYQSAFGLQADLQRCLDLLKSHERIDGFDLGQHDVSDRFQIPEKLYGRTQEVNGLLQAFERVRAGSSEILLVTGEPGIGKSSLIYEIYKSITEAQGYFIAGKFDQFQQHIPYHALSQAFQKFVKLLLAEPEDRLIRWRTTILQAVGNVGKVLTDVIPNLELVVGPQPEVPQLASARAQNRFNYVFGNFVKAIAQQEHPLVFFIDDMQWIDSASLNLLTILMSDQEIHYFLCIGAYRDNETSPSHPLVSMLDGLKQQERSIDTLSLPSLSPEHVRVLITETLHHPEGLEELSDIIFEKTHGNPFFVKQFLRTLYDKQCLEFVHPSHSELKGGSKGGWRWDMKTVQQACVTDNVVDLMVARVRKLPELTQELLTLGACIGNHFDLKTLHVISEKTPREMTHVLQPALTEGILFPVDSAYALAFFETLSGPIEYTFAHDRIQEAAYSLIPEHKRVALHLKIGALLCEKLPQQQKSERIFEVMNHLNAGRQLLDDPEDVLKLAVSNLEAGRKAKASIAYHPALRFFTIGTELLSEKNWENQHPLAFALHRELYECTYLTEHFEEAERLFTPILEHSTSNLEKAEMYNIRIVQYNMMGETEEAIEMGRKALRLFGLEFPEHDIQTAIQQEFEEIRLNLGTKKIADLIHLPMMSNPDHKKTITLLNNLVTSTYQNHPDAFRFIIARMVNMTLKHGTAQESSFGFTAYGVILGSDSGKYHAGYEFGKLGIQLSETFKNAAPKCRPYHAFGRYINHWQMPIKFNVLAERQAFQYGLECGDVLNAGFALSGLIQALFSKGEHVERVLAEIEKGLDFAKKAKNSLTLHACRMWRQFMLNLQGQTRDTGTFSDQHYHESQLLTDMKKSLKQTCELYILKLHSLYVYEQYGEALGMARETELRRDYMTGELTVVEQNFYYSLTLSALYQTANEEEQRDYKGKLKTNQKQMKIWFDNCPENFQHKYLLIEAEIARIEGRNWDAVELYRKAIDDAREHEFIQHEALGNELLAKFWLEQGEEKIARVYMTDAHYDYQLWGAKGKAKDLQQRYPHIIAAPQTVETPGDLRLHDTDPSTSSDGISEELLDLTTVMKTSQTISGEITLSSLLSKMMSIVLENAGAQRGLLILLRNDQWMIEAESDVSSQDHTIFPSLPLDGKHGTLEHAMIPQGIVNYVIRTREALILNNACEDGNFHHDVYIQAQQPKSLLCLPLLYKGNLSGILYLENNLTTGAFTTHRIQVLQMLASQAAISIEHARLYDTLEQQVQERTLELEQEITVRKQAEKTASEANQAKSEFLASMSHELRSPLNAILGYTQILNRDANLDERQSKAVEVIQRSGEHLLMVISDVLDLSKIEARKLEITQADFHLRRCLESVADIAGMRARQQGISFKMEFDDTLPSYIHGDEKFLRQVLLNLLNNAVKFTKKGEATLRVKRLPVEKTPSRSRQSSIVHFEVNDTGIGIAPEHLEQIFLPFYQIKDPTVHHNGAGLGLAISQRLLHVVGGELRAKSTIGQGTCFWFELEFAHAEPQKSASHRFSQNKIGYKGRLRRVIVADDQAENREVLKDVLLPLGFEVSEASNGKELIDEVLAQPPDLMLVDLMMPGLTGFEAIRQIRQHPGFTHIPIIIISANVLNEVQQESLQAGAQEFLAKPICFETLLDKLQYYLALEWVYDKRAEENFPEESASAAQGEALLEAPSQETLEALFQSAMQGDVARLKEQAQELERADPSLRSFGKQLYHMASAYQIDEIQDFMAHYMEEQS